jgi:hypothetical protein
MEYVDPSEQQRHSHMSYGSQWRLALAQPVAAAYAANPKVAAVIIGGSISRGHADRYSDIEIGVFWHEPPTDDDRGQCAEASGADIHGLYPYDPQYEVWEDALFVGRVALDQPGTGVLVEIPHYTVEFIERVLDDLLERHDAANLSKQNIVAALTSAIPIHGAALIEKWHSRAADYPRGLALDMVKRHAQIEFLWRSDVFLERGNNLLLLYDTFTQISKQLLYVLLGLNRIYHPGFKWTHLLAERMQIAPSDFYRRMQQVFQSEPLAAVEELRALVEETYTLIEQEMPEIDVERLRRLFRYRRQSWDDPPPGFL